MLLSLLFFSSLSATAHANSPLSAETRFDRLVVLKKERTLKAYSQGKLVRTYKIALGFTPVGAKEFEGDGKTPEGVYFVDAKNPHSTYYKNLGVSYPDKQDTQRANAVGKSPGGLIKIHGLGPRHRHLGTNHWKHNWTEGCVAVTDEEIDELYIHTNMNAKIEIYP